MSGNSNVPTDLSLLKGFSKNFSFEDFQNFQVTGRVGNFVNAHSSDQDNPSLKRAITQRFFNPQ